VEEGTSAGIDAGGECGVSLRRGEKEWEEIYHILLPPLVLLVNLI